MIKKYMIILFILVQIFSSCSKNTLERNTIVFEDSNQVVGDSLSKMLKLLPKLKNSRNGFLTNYYFKENKFYLNSTLVDISNNLDIDTINDFNNYNKKEKKTFISLANFLNRNHMSSGYFEKSINLWLFNYRELLEGGFSESRDIVYQIEADSMQLKSSHIILDHKKNIFLLAPLGARLR